MTKYNFTSSDGKNYQYSLRFNKVDDIPTLVEMRYQMFLDMGFTSNQFPDDIEKIWKNYFFNNIQTNQYIGWVVQFNDSDIELTENITKIVAGGGIVIDIHPPGPSNISGKIGYIMNVYTYPEHRHHGIATQLVQVMLNWLRSQNIFTVALHASEQGKPLYRKFGFNESNEMKLQLQ